MSRKVRQAMLDFIALFKRRGVAWYTGENVMVVEEELQCVGKRLSVDGSLTHDHVIDVLTGLCICSNTKFKSVFHHLLSNAELDCLQLVLPNVPFNLTPLETLEAMLDKACDMYNTLCIAPTCGSKSRIPRDEAAISRNRDSVWNRNNNNSSGGRGHVGNGGRGNGGGRGRGGGHGGRGNPQNSDAVEYHRKAWENCGIKFDSDGVLKVNCKVCGLNTTHSSGFHNTYIQNPSTIVLPRNHPYIAACQIVKTTRDGQPPPSNPPHIPPPSQPPGQNSSGQAGSLVLDRASLESKMSQYERNSTNPNASSIWFLQSVFAYGPIHPSPVSVVPNLLAPATSVLGGDIYITWSIGVILAEAKLCLGLFVHYVNIGVGGGRSTTREHLTVSNAIS
eukprot:scaffold51757_cov42-Cyclotella_meneghiniana.AAC.10